MPQNDKTVPESKVGRTSRNLAYGMMAIYGVLLFGIGLVAALKNGDNGKEWVDLLKSGFLILGGGLTTIIGYYFGSRGTQEAQEIAEIAEDKLHKESQEFAEFKRDFAPTEDENSLKEPDAEIPEDNR